VLWLCASWAALTGKAPPPCTAAVLLADDIREWTIDSPGNDPRLYKLWTRLRINVIGSIWHARCQRDQGTIPHFSVARLAITNAVAALVKAINRDWLRTTTDIRTLDNGFFCTAWWRGMDPQLSDSQFSDTWSHPLNVFYHIDLGDPSSSPPPPPTLHLHLGDDLPLPFPP
jgi:hypothetical protein